VKTAYLDRLRFSGFHKSHVGAIQSCLDYFDIRCSPAWLYGVTGGAFLTILDSTVSAPNIGEPEEAMFELARHLGVEIKGFHTFATGPDSFRRLQEEAWDAARHALDRGWPVFAKELDLGNETSVVYAYDDEGYYTHSWHAGRGHEGFDEVIPWTRLGRNYCPCRSCRTKIHNGELSNEGVYTGDPENGGFISLHWASPTPPSDDRTALRAALRFVLEQSERSVFEWGDRTFHSGLSAYDRWIDTLRSGTIQGFYMGYYSDMFHESRRYAQLFLQEAGERFGEATGEQFLEAAEHYKLIREHFQALNELFPWAQPRAPIEDPDRRRDAIELLERVRGLEAEGRNRLVKLNATLWASRLQ
jgi:hypothetical protein